MNRRESVRLSAFLVLATAGMVGSLTGCEQMPDEEVMVEETDQALSEEAFNIYFANGTSFGPGAACRNILACRDSASDGRGDYCLKDTPKRVAYLQDNALKACLNQHCPNNRKSYDSCAQLRCAQEVNTCEQANVIPVPPTNDARTNPLYSCWAQGTYELCTEKNGQVKCGRYDMATFGINKLHADACREAMDDCQKNVSSVIWRHTKTIGALLKSGADRHSASVVSACTVKVIF